jgi:hypothetical protein
MAATRRLHRSRVRFRGIALTAQFLHPGTDRLEIISGTGLSHVSTSIRLAELLTADASPAQAIVLRSAFGASLGCRMAATTRVRRLFEALGGCSAHSFPDFYCGAVLLIWCHGANANFEPAGSPTRYVALTIRAGRPSR